jgi:molecular chaperone DnaK (HSP70)
MTASIHAKGIVPRTGLRRYQFTIANADLLDHVQITPNVLANADEWYMVVSLAREVGKFVRIRPTEQHRSGAEARRHVGQFLRVPPSVLQSKEFVVVALRGARPLDMEIEVDTDHPTLIAAAQRFAAGKRQGATAGVPVSLDIDAFVIESETKGVLSSRVDARLMLSPMQEMRSFPGYAALDFGNTSTTLACSETNQPDFDVIQADVLDALADHPAPVLTALRITGIKAGPKPADFTEYESRIGQRAMEGREDEWLVLGAKRLLSDRRQADIDSGSNVVILNNTTHEVPHEDPAEVFIARMLQGFFYHRQAIPEPIVVTCPTTFSDAEVNRLRRTVARAFHRVSGKDAASFRPELIDSRVPVVIDEASAAAFYFVYRDFVSGPGRMPAFRYLYPEGMHMLLYDCGGGTTDLSLVRLEAADDEHLKISVLGRAGHRTFGGDFITEQVFRLLKMKLATLRGEIPPPPAPAKLADFLETNRVTIDRVIPTTYDVRQIQNQAAIARRDTTLALWQVAERLKVRLSAPGVQAVTPEFSEQDLLNQVWRAVNPTEPSFPEESMVELKLQRRELDALIDPEIQRTIEYANDLIETCMEQRFRDLAAKPGSSPAVSREVPEVHWVYVVGNASRYPRIREMLLEDGPGLRVRYLRDRLARVSPEDFKNSVAKGAIVAMKLRTMAMGITVSWDQQLVQRLPFDVVHVTLGKAGDRVLYPAGVLYQDLLPKTIDVKADPVTGRAVVREVALHRRWPGERRAEPYVIFRFPEPIEGPYLVTYDVDEESDTAHRFVCYPKREGGAEDKVVGDPFEAPPYLAPPQSGKI